MVLENPCEAAAGVDSRSEMWVMVTPFFIVFWVAFLASMKRKNISKLVEL